MNKSMAWSVRPQARRLAERAARRAGVSLEEWLDEAIMGRPAGANSEECDDEIRSHASRQLDGAWLDEAEDLLESAITRIERRMRRGEERMARAFETMTCVLERTRERTLSPGYRQSAAAAEQRPETAPQFMETRGAHVVSVSHQRTGLHRRLDEQLEEIARRIEAAREMVHGPNASLDTNSERRRLDLRAAVSQIALRRQALDEREARRAAASRPAQQDLAGENGRAAPEPDNSVNEASGEVATSPSPSPEAPHEDISGVAGHLDRCWQVRDQRVCAVDLTAMREGIAAMNRSLAELAPRNAVLALEGAVRDLTERVALLRREGERESLLAPLDAMAAELRTCLKSRDPQPVVAGLEREVTALAGKIDALAGAAISSESFDRIQRQTEEVRNLLAAAVTRSAPLERLERQISELADRIEHLGASPAPQVESEQMAASLADLRGEIERSSPLSALMLIERRLEQIAARLDQEIVQPVQNGVDSHNLEDLARRIDGVRQSLDARLQPQFDTRALEASLKDLSAKLESPNSEPLAALMRDISDKLDAARPKDAEADQNAIEPMLAEIIDKLDRLPHPGTMSDLNSIERLLQSLDAKLDFGAGQTFGPEIVGQIAEEVSRRLEKDFAFRTDPHGLAEQIAYIHDRLGALSDLDGLQTLMRKLSVQLVGSTGEPSNNGEDKAPSLAVRTSPTGSSASVLRGIEALDATDSSTSGMPRRPFTPVPPANEDDSALSPSADDDVLLEPGAGAPQRVREAREPTREISPKTNPSISAHIAAARRAAQSALSEGSGQNVPTAAPAVARGLGRAKTLYANHRRSVLFAAAFAIVAMAALRFIGAHAPIVQKSELSGQPTETVMAGGSLGKPGAFAPAAAPTAPRVDTTPTASIGSASEAGKAYSPNGASGPQLLTTIEALLPASLRDAVVAGSPAAQYELAQRLFEGRGVPQDQQAAVLWLERAASSGLAPAQFRLGTFYNKGIGVQRDAAAAKRWYAKAAEAGNARAAHNLAVMYAEPLGETPDYVEAVKWFRKAAEWGVRDSEFNLAILYARGLGVGQDLRQSWLWFSLAAAQGDADAAKKRDEVAAKMDPDALAAAADDLAKFKVAKPDPAANEAASPPGGWDGKPGAPSLSQTPASVGAATPMSPP
jgi:localization factor PodJL